MRNVTLLVCLFVSVTVYGQTQLGAAVTPFVSIDVPVFVLNHVQVIDGTGAAVMQDQMVVIAKGKIQSIGPSESLQPPKGAQVLDRAGYTVIPGLVGMHDHLFYTDSYAVQHGANGKLNEPGMILAPVPYTTPRLYLAAGVTTMRTAGSLEPYSDLKVKQRIDANLMQGPAIDVTSPYLEGSPTPFAQIHELTGPEDAKRMVDYWAAEGMTSYKAYMNITREELAAAIQEVLFFPLLFLFLACSSDPDD